MEWTMKAEVYEGFSGPTTTPGFKVLSLVLFKAQQNIGTLLTCNRENIQVNNNYESSKTPIVKI